MVAVALEVSQSYIYRTTHSNKNASLNNENEPKVRGYFGVILCCCFGVLQANRFVHNYLDIVQIFLSRSRTK